jgi:hypothetical protein
MINLKAHPFFSEHSYAEKWGNLLDQKSPLQANEKLSTRPKNKTD